MHRVFGLARDPFAPVCDGDLFWESTARSETRAAACALLRRGQGVWLSGPPGSGRSALLGRLAEDLTAEGRPVVQAELAVSPSAEAFLAGLLEVVGAEDQDPARRGLLPVAAALYPRLLEAFCARGSVPCFPGPVSAAPDVVAELEILSRLRLLGEPLVALALAGAGESPLPSLQTVRISPPSVADLRACLVHRICACGGDGLLDPAAVDRIASRAGSFDEALTLGRRALSRAAYFLRLQPQGPTAQPSAATPAANPPPSLFDPSELDEVARLLDSLGPERPDA